MKPVILLFHFTDKPRLDKIIRAIMPLKIRIKKVEVQDYLQPIGYLAGSKDMIAIEEKYNGPDLEDEMLFLADLTSSQIDQLLLSFRKAGVRIPLKAVLTESNQHWNALQLYEELKAENNTLNNSN